MRDLPAVGVLPGVFWRLLCGGRRGADGGQEERLSDYAAFLAGKVVEAPRRGLKSTPALAGHLKRHQADAVAFNLELGSAGTYFATGLGKTCVGLEYGRHARVAAGKPALILTPLAVAQQWAREGERFGYDVGVIRSQADAHHDLNVCNLDRLHLLDRDRFGVCILDESGCLKAFTGKRSREIIQAFSSYRWRLGLSATPAPNDHTELAQQAEFLGVMTRAEMLVRWFINDSGDTKNWRLKGHAREWFFDWLASWSRMAEHPRDLGYDEPGYDLPALNIIRHRVDDGQEWQLGGEQKVSATTLHDIKRRTIAARADLVAEIVSREPAEQWLVWVDTDYEADAVSERLPSAVEVRGSHHIDRKEEALSGFATGAVKDLITKGKVAGWGLNYQNCARQVFTGQTFSYEMFHQMVRRSWRFGQARAVDVHLVFAEGDDQIARVVDRKAAENARLLEGIVAAMRRNIARSANRRAAYQPTHEGRLPAWLGRTS